MPAEDTLQEQVGGEVEQEHGSQDDQHTADGSGNDEDFLVVDERTKYKTAEDAQKGFKEAGQRIAQLSTWETEIGKRYGVNDPKQIAAALDEYIEMKEKDAAAKGKGAEGKATTSEPASKLTPKEQEALAWLKKVAPELGFVPKADLDAIKKQLETLQGGFESQHEARMASQVEAGRGQLAGLLTEAKLPVTEEFSAFMENSMASWVNADEQRVARWMQGGASASSVLKEAFNYVSKQLGIVKTGGTASYQAKKQGTSTTAVKRLPQPGLPGKTAATQQVQQKSRADHIREVNERAFAAASKAWGGATTDNGE